MSFWLAIVRRSLLPRKDARTKGRNPVRRMRLHRNASRWLRRGDSLGPIDTIESIEINPSEATLIVAVLARLLLGDRPEASAIRPTRLASLSHKALNDGT